LTGRTSWRRNRWVLPRHERIRCSVSPVRAAI